MKHGGATAVRIGLAPAGASIELPVVDDSAGSAVPASLGDPARDGHFGRVGMRERTEQSGGALRVASAPGAGTTVTLRLDQPVRNGRRLPRTPDDRRPVPVVLADDHAVLRGRLRVPLDAEPDLRVAGEAGAGPRALTEALRPDVLVLDLPRPSGAEVAERVRAASASVRVLALTAHRTRAYLDRLSRAEAAKFVTKEQPRALLRPRRGPVVRAAPDGVAGPSS